MSIDYTRLRLNEFLRELESLENYKTGNTYVDRLIGERLILLHAEIKSHKKLIDSRK